MEQLTEQQQRDQLIISQRNELAIDNLNVRLKLQELLLENQKLKEVFTALQTEIAAKDKKPVDEVKKNS